MKEITKMIYVSEDGKEFLDKIECEQHETSINETKKLKAHIKEYCKNMSTIEQDGYPCCQFCATKQCPFYNEDCDCNCVFEDFPYQDFD